MSDLAIRVTELGKCYRIGVRPAQQTLREALADFVRRPWRRPSGDNTFWALRDVSFEVRRGEVLGVIGRNGSGKSTLLKILSRVTEPTEGQAEFSGRMGTMLEVGTGFHPDLTGRENIYMNGAILGMRKREIDDKFDEIVAFSEIERFLDTPVKRYSSGMYVRLAFAVAAHLEPEILLIDEVLAVGDSAFQKKCLGKMDEVAKGGRTVLFVSHNMGVIGNLCSRALCLSEGRMLLEGEPREVIAAYSANNQTSQGEVRWPDLAEAPGDDTVRLTAVRLVSDGAVTSDPLIDRAVCLEVEYVVLREVAQLDVAIHLRDYLQAFVLATANRPSVNFVQDPWYGKPRPRGRYRTVCRIPENFFNDLTYSIDVGILNHKAEWVVNEESVLTFQVQETGAMKKEYIGKWVGVIRPRLAWTTEFLE